MKGKGKTPMGGVFRNASRIDLLYSAIQEGNRDKLEEIINDRAMNAQASKKLKGKGVSWETLQEDTVYQLQGPGSPDPVVAKLFDDLPFHEICGNVIATKLIESSGPFFVRCLDIGRFTDTAANYFIILEYVPDDPEGKPL